MSGFSLWSGSVHSRFRTGAAELPRVGEYRCLRQWLPSPVAGMLPCSLLQTRRHGAGTFLTLFWLSALLPFWQERAIHHSRTARAVTSCQAFRVANKSVIFGFRLQKMFNPPLRIFPLSLVGRECLSSATSVRQGLMNDDPVRSCIYIQVAESHRHVIPYRLMAVAAPPDPRSYVTILSLTGCLPANRHQVFRQPHSLHID